MACTAAILQKASKQAVLLAAARGLSQDNDGNRISTCLDYLLLP